MYSIIIAMDSKNGISKDDKIPWKSKSDMEFVKEITTGDGYNALIMGRKTYETLKKPLANRLNIVMSHQDLPNTIVMKEDIKEYLNNTLCDEVFVFGGKLVYDYFIDNYPELCQRIYLSRFPDDYDCDTFVNLQHFILTYFELIEFEEKADHTLYIFEKRIGK
jgi:dihydrofolate reductase